MGTTTINPIVAALTAQQPKGLLAHYGDQPDVLEAIRVAKANGRGAEWIAQRLSTDEVTITRGQVDRYLRSAGIK